MLRSALLVSLCLAGAHAATPVAYVRPINADCVKLNGSTTQLAYIVPDTYYLQGTASRAQQGYTSVCTSVHVGTDLQSRLKHDSRTKSAECQLEPPSRAAQRDRCSCDAPACLLAAGWHDLQRHTPGPCSVSSQWNSIQSRIM